MFEYQKYQSYFALVTGKMEALCAEEFRELGAENVVETYRGLSFEADFETLYRLNYESRLATRVLAPLKTFRCHSPKYLKQIAQQLPWDSLISLKDGDTFAIRASVAESPQFRHSLYAAMCLKDAIADFFVANFGRRPDVDRKNPTVSFYLRIRKDRVTISLDTSGASLHKRNYRSRGVEAPMQETLAAAIVETSQWNGATPLWDPMCGSGTLLAEALMKYTRTPAQYLRSDFGFMRLPEYDPVIWERVRSECDAYIRPLPEGLIKGSDCDQSALEAASENLKKLPWGERVELKQMKFQSSDSFEGGTIIVNPPYGIRLESTEEVKVLYKQLGDFLKKKCNGTTAHIYVGDTSIKRSIGLKPSARTPLVNGQIEGELLKIESFRVGFRDKKDGTIEK